MHPPKTTQTTLATADEQDNYGLASSLPVSLKELPPQVIADLRTDHAGEVGAVWIYKGILFCTRDPQLRAFAERHIATEQSHLERVKEWLLFKHYSLLLPVWRITGFLTGALPALFGPRAVYATIETVESFVDQHYEEQVQSLAAKPELLELLQTLKSCQADEISHRNEAALACGTLKIAFPLRLWCAMVAWGSRTAVAICRYV